MEQALAVDVFTLTLSVFDCLEKGMRRGVGGICFQKIGKLSPHPSLYFFVCLGFNVNFSCCIIFVVENDVKPLIKKSREGWGGVRGEEESLPIF